MNKLNIKFEFIPGQKNDCRFISMNKLKYSHLVKNYLIYHCFYFIADRSASVVFNIDKVMKRMSSYYCDRKVLNSKSFKI